MSNTAVRELLVLAFIVIFILVLELYNLISNEQSIVIDHYCNYEKGYMFTKTYRKGELVSDLLMHTTDGRVECHEEKDK